MPTAIEQLLRDAIARNSGAVISLPSAGALRHFKTRFLADVGGGFWVEAVPTERPLIDSLIDEGHQVGLAFRTGEEKIVLTAKVLERDPAYAMNAHTQIEALLLTFPESMQVTQRRSMHRVRPGQTSELAASFWRISRHAYLGDRPTAAQKLAVQVVDLSAGGIGVTFHGANGEPPKIGLDDRLRIQIAYNGADLLLEGSMRHMRNITGPEVVRAGIQFAALEQTLEGRKSQSALTRIVGDLHRQELRRWRREKLLRPPGAAA